MTKKRAALSFNCRFSYKILAAGTGRKIHQCSALISLIVGAAAAAHVNLIEEQRDTITVLGRLRASISLGTPARIFNTICLQMRASLISNAYISH
jgi:hypothetical protein